MQRTVGTKYLEDRCLWVVIYSHDDLAVLHAGHMLYGTTDANCDVQLRRYHFACLTNLQRTAQIMRCHAAHVSSTWLNQALKSDVTIQTQLEQQQLCLIYFPQHSRTS